MRILHVNKFFYRRGGAESYMLDVAALQQAAGEDVEFFAMDHPDNQPARFEQFFPSYVELGPSDRSLTEGLRIAGRVLYSISARRGMEQVLQAFEPDVVHLHNIYHQLSPSILQPIKSAGIPAVMTLHDYKLACPTYLFLDHGQICEACLGGHYLNAVRRRCNGGSLSASVLNAVEMTLHDRLGLYSPVDLFLCPSRFIQSKMAQAGVFPDRMRHLPGFVESAEPQESTRHGAGIVFIGRLSYEKGVETAIRAAARAGCDLDIAGDGPDRIELERLAGALGDTKIRFHGRVSPERVAALIRSAAATVVPSLTYENQPRVILESFAAAVPVIGSDLGGIPELVRDGQEGMLVPPGDVDAMAEAVRSLLSDPERARVLGLAGRKRALHEFSPSRHLAALGTLYEEAARSKVPAS